MVLLEGATGWRFLMGEDPSSRFDYHLAIMGEPLRTSHLSGGTSGFRFQGVQGYLAHKKTHPCDPTAGLCLGSYGVPMKWAFSDERGIPAGFSSKAKERLANFSCRLQTGSRTLIQYHRTFTTFRSNSELLPDGTVYLRIRVYWAIYDSG